MNEILTDIIMTGSGRHTFKGLFNENGFPVKVVLEKDDNEAHLSIIYDDGDKLTDDKPRDCGISDEEIDRVCQAHIDCVDCPLCDHCNDEGDVEDEC